MMMLRIDVLRTVIENAPDSPIIFTTGYTCREAYAVADRPNHIYMTGSMGMAPLLGAGIAKHSERTTIVVDGDGALMMNPGALLTIQREMPSNLLHLVIDNGMYESTGAQPTSSAGFDFVRVASAFGYPRATELDDLARLPRIIAQPSGPHLVRIKVRPGGPSTPRIAIEPAANFYRFRSWMSPSRAPQNPQDHSTLR